MKTCLFGAAAVLMTTGLASASIVNEDFESYADTAGLGGVWSLGDGTLDTGFGNPGQSMSHPGTGGSFTGANTNSLSFGSVYPGAGEVLVFSADIYDDAANANRRNTAGLRAAAGANIIEMGMYNSPSHYAIRTVLFGAGSDGSWVAFDNMVDDAGDPLVNAPVQGWHTFRAEITDSQVVFTLDLNGDGNINGTHVASIVQNAAFGFDIVRLGGPSDLSSSTNGGVSFDNVLVEVVPEPGTAALALAGLSALGLRRRSA
ncbi:MAG: PEP-CTERM sorting domain-containing protein [Phycisphaeraceae bacterium]